jgi:hypothetical protein
MRVRACLFMFSYCVFMAWHRTQRICKLFSSLLPPCHSGIMWSTWDVDSNSSLQILHFHSCLWPRHLYVRSDVFFLLFSICHITLMINCFSFNERHGLFNHLPRTIDVVVVVIFVDSRLKSSGVDNTL